MSVSDALNIAQSALAAQQFVMNTTAENIANANTPGYTVETTNLVPSTPLLTAGGAIGTGVNVAGTERLRSAFLDDAFRTDSGLSGQYTTAVQTRTNRQYGLKRTRSAIAPLMRAGVMIANMP